MEHIFKRSNEWKRMFWRFRSRHHPFDPLYQCLFIQKNITFKFHSHPKKRSVTIQYMNLYRFPKKKQKMLLNFLQVSIMRV